MPKITRAVSLILALLITPVVFAQHAAQQGTDHRFLLTVDSIMRGPDLVGYPPDGLRWSADSQKLYFEWRKPGEEEASTYVVGRDGGTPVKLTDEQKKSAPPVNGRWDKAHKRVVFADRGDIAMIDERGTRHQITRTTGAESSPRWARNDTAITYVRDGNLFLVPIDREGASEIAHRARGTPRIVNRLIKRVRDFAQIKAQGRITRDVAHDALAWLGIDSAGFDEMDRKILLSILDNFRGGPVGVESLAAAVNEEKTTLEDVYEPYLLQQGFIGRTPRGRVANKRAYEHLGIPFEDAPRQTKLF